MTDLSLSPLKQQLKRDEGLRLFSYVDTVGKLTIGYGRNLADVGISSAEADYLLDNDIRKAEGELLQALPWVVNLDDARQAVLVNMAFNIGVHGLLGFRNMLSALEAGVYEEAAKEMEASRWAEQVGARAQRLIVQMRTGVFQ